MRPSMRCNVTCNGISVYVTAKRENKAIADDMNHAYMPIGPAGNPADNRFQVLPPSIVR